MDFYEDPNWFKDGYALEARHLCVHMIVMTYKAAMVDKVIFSDAKGVCVRMKYSDERNGAGQFEELVYSPDMKVSVDFSYMDDPKIEALAPHLYQYNNNVHPPKLEKYKGSARDI